MHALICLEAWQEMDHTDEAFSPLAQWLRAGGLKWFDARAQELYEAFTSQNLIEHRVGGLLTWQDMPTHSNDP